MQFPILPPPQIAPVAGMPPVSVDVTAHPAFADVLAALSGAPLVAMAAPGGAVAVMVPDVGESPDFDSGEDAAPPVEVLPDLTVAPVIADRVGPVPDDGVDTVLTDREVPVPGVAIPMIVGRQPDASAEPPAAIADDMVAPAPKAGPLALPERPVPSAPSEVPRAGPAQTAPAAPALKPALHPPVPLTWALPDAVAPGVGEGKVASPPPPAKQVQSVPASVFAPGSVAQPTPAPSADSPPVGGEVLSLRSDSGLVSAPAPAIPEGPRPVLVAPPLPVTPQAVAAQIAVALGRSADGTIDIALHPQELGRLRLSLTPTDAGLVVTIAAERLETLDLLRRHAADLGQDLRSLGFRDVDLNFGAPGSDHFRRHPAPSTAEDVGIIPTDRSAVSPSSVAPVLHGVGGLDIRL